MDRDKVEDTQSSSNNQLDRRAFVKFIPALGAAGLAAVNLPISSPAQTPSASPTPIPSPTPSQPSQLAEAYAEVARVRFGKHLEDSQWDRVKRDLEGNVRTADRLRESKLKNSDEPDFIFIA